MENPNSEFVEQANPHSWFLVADQLHTQALAIYGGRGQRFLTHYKPGNKEVRRDTSDNSVFLLAGFALENAIKGFLVYENPDWIANGHLSRELKSHSLAELKDKSNLIPYPIKYRYVLEGFEDGLEGWARYPCALTAAKMKKEGILSDRMWAGYQTLMRAYGNKMIKLLAAGWNDPYGDLQHFKISEGFLDMCD